MYSTGNVRKLMHAEELIIFRNFLTALVIFSFFMSGKLSAQGNLLISPRRVVFEGSKRTEELNLANTGSDTARYNISVIEYRMKDDGSFEQITEPDPGQNFADKFIRFFPRSVTLAPNEAQIVRMQLMRTKDLAQGEYRSHIYFRAVPNIKPLGEEEAGNDENTIAVKLTPIFGITIPVIIRVGKSTAKVSLSNTDLEMINDTIPRLTIKFNRSGNMSVYGNITVDYISPDGQSKQVGIVKGLAVYTPNLVRYFHFDLLNDPDVNYREGELRINYTSQSENNNSELLAGTVLKLK